MSTIAPPTTVSGPEPFAEQGHRRRHADDRHQQREGAGARRADTGHTSRQRDERSTRAPSISSHERRRCTALNPSSASDASESWSRRCWRRMAAGGGRGALRLALRSSATAIGRSRTMATDGRRCRRATAISCPLAQSSTLVASTTVRRPWRRRMARTRWSRSNASSVAACAVGSSVIMARMASDERISVGAKWRRANVLFPLAAIPINRTRPSVRRRSVGETDRPPRSSAAGGLVTGRGSAPCVAVRAHLRLRDRRLRLARGSRQGAPADGRAGLADEMHLAEVAIRQPPRHITSLLSGGRGHRADSVCGRPIVPEIGPLHKSPPDLAACPAQP